MVILAYALSDDTTDIDVNNFGYEINEFLVYCQILTWDYIEF